MPPFCDLYHLCQLVFLYPKLGILHMPVDNSVARMQPKRNTGGRGNALSRIT